MLIKCGIKDADGVRQKVNCACDKSCIHWKECVKELNLKKDPRMFKEIPAGKWDIKEENFHLNYKGIKSIWKMLKST